MVITILEYNVSVSSREKLIISSSCICNCIQVLTPLTSVPVDYYHHHCQSTVIHNFSHSIRKINRSPQNQWRIWVIHFSVRRCTIFHNYFAMEVNVCIKCVNTMHLGVCEWLWIVLAQSLNIKPIEIVFSRCAMQITLNVTTHHTLMMWS